MPQLSIWLMALAAASFTAKVTAADAELMRVTAAMKNSFEAKRQATLDRLDQDETQALCTSYTDSPLPPAIAQRIAAANRATIRPPAAGQYLGDWKRGEQIAETGTGLQFSDDPSKPAGGNCYACHELSGVEMAFGTIGPSLRHYGKLRGATTVVLEMAWGKLYNSNAQTPCSNMPRFGHRGILTEQQLKDVMAYLFDSASPVNQ
ncbi:MAG: sulfur oxidation c-type cytochrome SoxX [Gammaproteobacteria bacterium]|nr:sulfur oxidation c-type cytochrome SoxX [Gammaproteobacteria bacterium]